MDEQDGAAAGGSAPSSPPRGSRAAGPRALSKGGKGAKSQAARSILSHPELRETKKSGGVRFGGDVTSPQGGGELRYAGGGFAALPSVKRRAGGVGGRSLLPLAPLPSIKRHGTSPGSRRDTASPVSSAPESRTHSATSSAGGLLSAQASMRRAAESGGAASEYEEGDDYDGPERDRNSGGTGGRDSGAGGARGSALAGFAIRPSGPSVSTLASQIVGLMQSRAGVGNGTMGRNIAAASAAGSGGASTGGRGGPAGSQHGGPLEAAELLPEPPEDLPQLVGAGAGCWLRWGCLRHHQ